MGLRRHIQNHKGAGILFARFREGRWEVLLCQRRKSGVWSLPGGLKEKDESYFTCAVREASEEVGSPSTPNRLNFPRVLSLRLSPVVAWDTFLWVFEDTESGFSPDWPTEHCPEFRQVGWYPLDNPPKPLYFLMEPTLLFARMRLKNQATA